MALPRRKESMSVQRRESMGDRLPTDTLRGVWRYARQNLDRARAEAAAKGLPEELSFLMVAKAIRKSVAQVVRGKSFLLTVQEDQKKRRGLQEELVGEVYKFLQSEAHEFEYISGNLVSTLKRALPGDKARNVSEDSVEPFAYDIWTSVVRFQEHREFVKRASQEIEELGSSASSPSPGPRRRPAAAAAQSGVREAVDVAVDKIMGAGRQRQGATLGSNSHSDQSVVTRAIGSLAEGLKKPGQKKQFNYLQSLMKEGLDEMEAEHGSLIRSVFKLSRAFFSVEQIKVKLPVEASDDASTAAQPRGLPPVTWKPPNRKNLDQLWRKAARRGSILSQFRQVAASGIAKARASAGDEASVEEDATAVAANLREAARTGAAHPGAARSRRPEEGAAAAAEGRGARGAHGEGAGGDELPEGEDRDASAAPGSGGRLARGKASGLGGGAGAADSGEEPGELGDRRRRGEAGSRASAAGLGGASGGEDLGDREEASLDSEGISEDEALEDLQRRLRKDNHIASMMFFSDKDKAILQRLELDAAGTGDRADSSAPGEGDFGASLAAAGGGVVRQLAQPGSSAESSDFGGNDSPAARGGGERQGIGRLPDAAGETTEGPAGQGPRGGSFGKEKLSLEITGRRLSQAAAAPESPSAAARAKAALADASAIAHAAARIQREFLGAKTSDPAAVKRWTSPQQSPRAAALALALRQPKPIVRGQRPRQVLLPEEEPASGLRLPALVASPRRYEGGHAAVATHAVIVVGPSWRAAAQAQAQAQASTQAQAPATLTMPRAPTFAPRSARGPTRPKGNDLPQLLSARDGSKELRQNSKEQPPHVLADDPALQPLSRVKRIRADAFAALQSGTTPPPPRSSGGVWSAPAKTRSYTREVVGLACVVPDAPRGLPLRVAGPLCGGEDMGGDTSWTLWDRLGSVY